MTSFHLKNRWGILRTGQLCTEIFNDKLNKALQYAVRSSIYDPELTLKELTTAQSILLSLLYGLLHRDIPFCLNIIEASSAAVQLRSSYIKVWLKDDFNFKPDDVAKAFSNLATLMTCKFPLQLELPPYVTVAFSGLVDKYKLLDVFNSSGDKTALEFVKELNTYVLELAKNLETTLEVEESTSESVDNHLEVNVEASPIVDDESTLSPTLPEIQRLVINDEEITASLPRYEVANEGSRSSSPAPMPSSSRLEVQTNNCDNKESTSSSGEPKIEAPKKKFIWVKRDAVPSLPQPEVQTSNCDNKESTSSSALPKTKVLRKFVRVEVDVSSPPRAEDVSESSSPSAPPDTTPPMIEAGNEASGSSSPAPTPSSSRLEDDCESTRPCNVPVPSWYNECEWPLLQSPPEFSNKKKGIAPTNSRRGPKKGRKQGREHAPAVSQSETSIPQLEPTTQSETCILELQPATQSETSIPQLQPATQSETSIPQLQPSTQSETSIPQLEPTTQSETSIPQIQPVTQSETCVLQLHPATQSATSITQLQPATQSETPIPQLQPSTQSETPIPQLQPSTQSENSIPQLQPATQSGLPSGSDRLSKQDKLKSQKLIERINKFESEEAHYSGL